MQSIEKEIEAASAAASKVTSIDHVKHIIKKLRASGGEFRLTDEHIFHGNDRPGIYLIEIHFSSGVKAADSFAEQWNANQPKCNSRAYIKRALRHFPESSCGYLPLYLGKAMNVPKRLTEHLKGKADSSTYGLKLLARADVLKGCTLKANWVNFGIGKEGYFCIELLEAKIRGELHPIVGKQ
jgi:hypothetical protein